MIYIENLSEFVKQVIDKSSWGTFFPQNAEYVNTSEMVELIAEVHGKKMRLTKVFNPIIRVMCGVGVVNKVFGNLVYEKSMSDYSNIEYRARDFRETIELTEGKVSIYE